MPSIRRTVSRDDLTKNPKAVWNAYVDLLAMSDSSELNEAQRPAFLVFWYESEVQNGGHLQYFLNRGFGDVDETVQALQLLDAVEQAGILQQAADIWRSKASTAPTSVEEYVDEALEFEFEDLDRRFYECELELSTALENHLTEHESVFIIRE